MSEAVHADRVVVMDKGRVVMDGTPLEVFSQPEKLWGIHLDVPQTVELLYLLKQSGLDVRTDIFDPDECAEEVASAVKRLAGGK
jgi:energy-coupling factor transporter ATP-binding protein EcfA2